ncbi:MAG TPA: redox-regulated ATPase YchF [Candidatus Acidoferrum sp.]|jgi:GTP-binding protein YchF|nr:redox-regulated ATPase YchF [Candidatus Acidoferrum sp.]
MKTGIIGLPQVGKTSLFRILTKAHLSAQANPRDAHIGVAKVPDDRLHRLAALYNPKKLTYTSVEYVDLGAIGQDALKETAYIGHLRQVDALAHVVRVFEDPAVALVAEIDPLRDIKNVEFDLMVSDLGQIEKRLERLEKDLKKMKTPELEKEFELLKRANAHLGSEKPLREMEMPPEDKKRLRGFMFLSEKPIFYVLNIGESTELGKELEEAVSKYKLTEIAARPNAAATAICGKVEAELAEMSDADAAEFLGSYGLKESGLVRLIRTTYRLLGLISFFTAGEDECRAWQIPANTRAQEGAGAIHSDLQKHFIRAETIRWDQLLEAGSEANARAKGTLRLEGKDYIVQDGDVMHIRHSG